MLQSPSALSHQRQIGSAGLDAAHAQKILAGALQTLQNLLGMTGRRGGAEKIKQKRGVGWNIGLDGEKTGESLKWQEA